MRRSSPRPGRPLLAAPRPKMRSSSFLPAAPRPKPRSSRLPVTPRPVLCGSLLLVVLLAGCAGSGGDDDGGVDGRPGPAPRDAQTALEPDAAVARTVDARVPADARPPA